MFRVSLVQGKSSCFLAWHLAELFEESMQFAGRSNVQVASVSWERLLWNQITSCTFTSTYWRTFMNHPGIWFPSVPRHVTLSEDACNIVSSPFHWPYSRQVRNAQAVLKQPCQRITQLLTVWSENRLKQKHSQKPGREEHSLHWTVYVQGKPSAGQIFMLPCMASCRAVWGVIQLWWFWVRALLCFCGESDETDPKVCLEQGYIRRYSQLRRHTQGLKPQAHIPANQHSSVASSRLVAPVRRNVLVRFVGKVRLSAAASHEAGPHAPASIWCLPLERKPGSFASFASHNSIGLINNKCRLFVQSGTSISEILLNSFPGSL